jgi:GTP-binding protein SAR1
MVDAADGERLQEAHDELQGLLRAEEVKNIPIAVLANKCDVKSSLSREQLIKGLTLEELADAHSGPLQLFLVSVVKGTGYLDAFKWLSGNIKG